MVALGIGQKDGPVAMAWEAAGATCVLTSIEPQPPELEIRGVIEAGP